MKDGDEYREWMRPEEGASEEGTPRAPWDFEVVPSRRDSIEGWSDDEALAEKDTGFLGRLTGRFARRKEAPEVRPFREAYDEPGEAYGYAGEWPEEDAPSYEPAPPEEPERDDTEEYEERERVPLSAEETEWIPSFLIKPREEKTDDREAFSPRSGEGLGFNFPLDDRGQDNR